MNKCTNKIDMKNNVYFHCQLRPHVVYEYLLISAIISFVAWSSLIELNGADEFLELEMFRNE